jgi:hypothetical protein
MFSAEVPAPFIAQVSLSRELWWDITGYSYTETHIWMLPTFEVYF